MLYVRGKPTSFISRTSGQSFVDIGSASSVFLEVELFHLGEIKASRACPRWHVQVSVMNAAGDGAGGDRKLLWGPHGSSQSASGGHLIITDSKSEMS